MSADIPSEISGEELVRRVEAGEDVHVVDVRAPERLATGRVEVVPATRFHNVRGSVLMSLADATQAGLPRAGLLAVVCGHGNTSKPVSEHLRRQGFAATSLRGGVSAWMHVLLPRALEPPPELDLLVQGDRVGKGALSYLLASGGEALLVDPPRRSEAWLDLASKRGVRIVAVCDTHVHADYLSGAPALARRLGVPYRLHPADAVSPYDGAPAKWPFEPLAEGQRIRLGRAELEVVHTPGHTEGSVTLRLADRLALTGDFLFVASVGRPDLGDRAEAWSAVLFESLERARREWPACLRILPAHYASEGERRADRSVQGELGGMLGTNEPLAERDRERFRAWVRARGGPVPEHYRRIKRLNLGLERAADAELEVLEAGRNECAVS